MLSFCEECRNEVEFKIEKAEITGELNGTQCKFDGKKAICTKCGSELYVGEIEDENLKKLYDEYRLQNGIISLEEILEIPDKCGVDERKLSTIPGWKEMTFQRYCEGYIPTKEHSDKLKEIYHNSECFLDCLKNS